MASLCSAARYSQQKHSLDLFLCLRISFFFSSSRAIRQSAAQSGSALSLLVPAATWWWDSQHDWVNIIKGKLSPEIAAARFKQAGTTTPKESSTTMSGQTFVWINEFFYNDSPFAALIYITSTIMRQQRRLNLTFAEHMCISHITPIWFLCCLHSVDWS